MPLLQLLCIHLSTTSTNVNFLLQPPLQARAVSDLLQLDEWWTLEHSVFTFLLTASLLAILGRNKGTRLSLLCQVAVS